MKILIISATFPPLNTIGAGRPYSWAYYFSKFGENVTVVTYKKTHKDGELNYIQDCSNFELVEVDIFQKNRLKLFNFIKKGWDFIKKKNFDIVISTSYPWQTHYLAYLYKRKFQGVKWIADFRDLWSKNNYYSQKGIKYKVHSLLEKKIISKADLLTTVSIPLKEELERLHYINTEIIYNGFEYLQKSLKQKPSKKLTISYLGTIYHQRQDALLLLLISIEELIKENKISIKDIEVNLYGNHLADISKIINNNENYKKIVKINNLVTRKKSLEIQNKSNLLLFLEWGTSNAKGILTGKLFEYIASGTPILSIGPDKSFCSSELIKKTRTGFICEMDKNKIKEAILRIKNKNYIYSPNYEEIRIYSRENQAKKLLNLIYKEFKK